MAILLIQVFSCELLSRSPSSLETLRFCGSESSVIAWRFSLATNDSLPLPNQARDDLYSAPYSQVPQYQGNISASTAGRTRALCAGFLGSKFAGMKPSSAFKQRETRS